MDSAGRVMAESEWRPLVEGHRLRAERFTGPARERADRGLPHAFEDFLFHYYPFSFAKLENWHPGPGFGLEGVGDLPWIAGSKHYREAGGVWWLDPQRMGEKERARLEWTRSMLEATRDRAPNFGCYGLHEWAMVYRGQQVRHEKTTPLRLPQAEIDAVVESLPIVCSHFDAFRFFADAARPLNRLQPTCEGRIGMEQGACVHANMDLYKWSARSLPWVDSGLVLEAFELAMELRSLDMRASPYDVRVWGFEPVPIETEEGRRHYETEQRMLAARARELRGRLIEGIRILEGRKS